MMIPADRHSSCDVPLSEGRVNLSWTQIMKTINDDPYGFYESGGWSFVTGDGDVSLTSCGIPQDLIARTRKRMKVKRDLSLKQNPRLSMSLLQTQSRGPTVSLLRRPAESAG